MERDIIIKQIILVTGEKSNVEGDSAKVAVKAYQSGIIVNTIRIIDKKHTGAGAEKRARNFKDTGNAENASDKIRHIAKAGGGSYERIYVDELFQAMRNLIHKIVNKTLKNVVNEQLKEMIGEDIDSMEPESRKKMLNYIDKFSDYAEIRCCILLDRSKSMADRIHIARHSISDLMHSFNDRKGRADIRVVVFSTSVTLAIEKAIGLINESNIIRFADSGGTAVNEYNLL